MSKKLTHEEFLRYFNQRTDADEYEFLTTYSGWNETITIRHKPCDHVYSVHAGNYLNGRKCNFCANYNRKIKHPNYIPPDRLRELITAQPNASDFEFLEDFDGTHRYVKARHKPCGKIISISPKNFIHNGYRCRECSIRDTNARKFNVYLDEFIAHVRSLGYELLDQRSVIVDSQTTFRLKCISCGNIITTSTNSFYENEKHYTGKCKCQLTQHELSTIFSQGELVIFNFLKEHDVDFSYQYRFNDCRNKNPLPFDFAIFDDNLNVSCLIEYDGAQHYCATPFFGGEEGLIDRQYWDNYKTQYCIEHNIKLIRITYKDNLIQKLKEELNYD